MLNHRFGVDRKVCQLMRLMMVKGVGPEVIAELVKESQSRRYDCSRLSYLDHLSQVEVLLQAISHLPALCDPASYPFRIVFGR